MDPLSIVASTIAVVQAISSTYKAIQHLKGLPNEFIEVNRNLPLAQETLGLARDQLQGLALDEPSKKAIQPFVSGCEEKAKMLQHIFEEVEKRTKKAKDGSVIDFYRTSLLYLNKAHRVEILMQGILRGLDALATNRLFKTATQSQVAQLKEAVDQLSNVESSVPDSDFEGSVTQNIASGATGHQSVISGQDHKINSGSGKQFIAQTMTFVQSNEDNKTRSGILQTLHTSPYRQRKNDRNPDRVPGTCEWFVGHDYFQQWRESKSSSMLWVSANPGCGKSVLAKYLADSVLQTTTSRTTCYFFFKDDYEDQRSAKSALSCTLHQIFTQREILFSDKIVKRFEAYKAHLTSSFDELWEVLVMTSQDKNSGELVCILDAFDECEDQERLKLAQALRKFYDPENDKKNNVNLKFLVTSRPYDKIRQGFQPLNIPGLAVIHLKGEADTEISKIAREIDVYIGDRVSRIRASLCLKPDEERLLLQRLRRIPNRTYLWVYLTLELIKSDISIDKTKISEATSSLPPTVDDAYERILAKSSNAEEAKKMLHIVVAATRPLTLAEMDLALALRQDHKSYEDLDNRPDERFGRYVRDLCGLFVTITDSKIYLFHQTAKEFLLPKDDPDPRGGHDNQPIWRSSLQPSQSHRILCQICIWHLLFTEFETRPLHGNLDGKVSRYIRDHVFLDYSAINWAAHFRASDIKDSAVLEHLLRICDASSRRCLTWFRIYWASTHTSFPEDFTTLMIASYFGLEQIVKLLLERDDVGVDSRDGTYQRSALSWASENGFDGIVKLLIKRPKIRLKAIAKLSFPKGAEVDATDKYGRTPLSYAAWNGHMAIVQRLVKAEARVDSEDEIGGTPISYALCSGQGAVASRLMKGAQMNSVDKISRELLLSAAEKGHEAIVKRLLDKGASVEAKDESGRTALWRAATNGREVVVKRLLDSGANTEGKDHYGRTLLLWAAEYGREVIVKMLLYQGANIEAKDQSGRTPLWQAAEYGREVIIKMLLYKGADVEAKDQSGRTPLWRAAAYGRGAVVELLLNNGANIEAKDQYGRTPLWQAAEYGRAVIVEMLICKGADVEAKDESGRTPLSWAAANGRDSIVELLLNKGADVEARDGSGETPLWRAAKYGRVAILNRLLDKDANVEAKDHYGQTLLWRDAANGHEAIVKMLLYKGADVEAKDQYGRTPLWRAAEYGREVIVKMLLYKDADVEAKDHYGQTPLWRAAAYGRKDIVKPLLDKGANVEAKDHYGRTPLWPAAANGCGAVVELLLDKGASVEAKDESGRTALWWAATNGREVVVELLLNNGANIEAKDQYGRTPLSWAAEYEREAIVKMLLNKGADVEAKDQSGRTPLWWAAANGHEAVAMLLRQQLSHLPVHHLPPDLTYIPSVIQPLLFSDDHQTLP